MEAGQSFNVFKKITGLLMPFRVEIADYDFGEII